MLDSLVDIRVALVAMSDDELVALHVAVEDCEPGPGSGTFAAVAHVCDWALQSRRGHSFRLSRPLDAIGPEDLAASLAALALLRGNFHAYPRIVALFDAIGEALQEPPPTVQ